MNLYESIKNNSLKEAEKYHYITYADNIEEIGAEYEYNSMSAAQVFEILNELKMYFTQAAEDGEKIINFGGTEATQSDIDNFNICASKVQEIIDKMN